MLKFVLLVASVLISLLMPASCTRRDETPLVEAVRSGNLVAVRTLARGAAALNAVDSHNGWTPLLHAVHTHQLRSALLLLELGADVNGRARDGYTPLMMAAGYGDTSFVRALLNAGADPRLESNDGATALSGAVGGVGHTETESP